MLNNFHEFEELFPLICGFRFPVSCFRIPVSGFRIPDSGFQFSVSGFRVLDRFLFLGHRGPIMVIDCDMHIDHYVFFMELDLISKILTCCLARKSTQTAVTNMTKRMLENKII